MRDSGTIAQVVRDHEEGGVPDPGPSGQVPAERLSPPLSAVLGLLLGLLLLGLASIPMRDIDLYWHLLAGEQLASGASVDALGTDWTFGAVPRGWVSTQWLAELGLYELHRWGGWPAIAGFRVLTTAVAIALLARTTLRGRPVQVAIAPFLIAALGIWVHAQERPQQFSYIGAAILGGVLARGLTNAQRPRWWLLLPATALWANLHGGWILTPVVLGLVCLGLAIDRRWRDSVGFALLSLGSVLAGLLSPAGTANVTAVVRFSGAAGDIIEEWGPTQPWSVVGMLPALMLGLAVLGWTRRGQEVPPSEIAVVLLLLVFSWMAWRNVPIALALMAPLVASRLDTALSRRWRREPSWSVPVGVALATAGALLAVATLPGSGHLPTEDYPVNLAKQVTQLPPGQRVLNDYAVAGLVLHFGGESTQVAIDGRTDRYGAEYLEQYRGVLKMEGRWQETLDRLDPTAALLKQDSGIAEYLEWKGWTVIGRESGFVLLQAPTTPQS